jgi:hypothetical protein
MAKRRTKRRESIEDSGSGTFSPHSSGWESLGPLADKPKKKRSGRASGRKSGRMSSARMRRSTGRVKAVQRPSGHALIPVICSECFEELAFDTGVKSDTLTCPVCEHTAARPDDATLARIESVRKAEKTNLTIGLALSGLSAAAMVAWQALMTNPVNAHEGGLFWGPLGLFFLLVLVLAIFSVKYEGNRFDVYF